MALTEEQQHAVEWGGRNILVSAGAGSGKTFVLTERVKYKLLHGVHISELLILTFTNAAAAEMKDRIRKMIQKTPELAGELDALEGAYITTFDSFALAVVKKYHTKLNITNQIQISDEVLIDLQKKKIMDEIFDEYYQSPKQDFLQLIHDFCLKGDDALKESILKAYQKIELKVDKAEYLRQAMEEDSITKMISSTTHDYFEILKSRQRDLIRLMSSLTEYFDGEFIQKMYDNFHSLMEAETYDDFVHSLDFESLRVPRGTSEEGKQLKSDIFSLAKDIEQFCQYASTREMEEEYRSTIANQKVLFSILQELDSRLEEYKLRNAIFTFTDISRYAIMVVRDNLDVLEELKNQFAEIMVDEYQDTSDTQELFLSYISKNNIYMVGDIKQSIYRFRNANPSLFKEKYRTYQDSSLGYKIDLLKNFRSREEVLSDINLIFDYLMDEEIGGADYQASHRMVFGNEDYHTIGKVSQDSHMEVLAYDSNELGKLSKEEEEAFLIAKDIQERIQNKMQVFDKEEKKLRPIEYRDFVILLDKSKNFELYKKIFEYHHIPLTILKEESLRRDDDGLVIRNLFRFLLCLKQKRFDLEFRYCFVSLCRSFLWKKTDQEIFDMVIHDKIMDSDLVHKGLEVVPYMDTMSLSRYFYWVMEEFHYEEKLLTIGRVHDYRIRLEYIYNLCKNYESHGYTIYDFVDYLNQIFEGDYDLKFNMNTSSYNSCQIMTIHKSKGLEYPVCYFAGFSSKFSDMDIKERIIYDSSYGFILPKVEEAFKDTYLKTLFKYYYKKEDISERIRLLYVAVTRAREKMIFVIPKQEEGRECLDVIPTYEREQYHSFLSIVKSIYSLLLPYLHEVEVIGSKEYLNRSIHFQYEIEVKEPLKVEEVSISSHLLEEKHYSKESFQILSKEEKDLMQLGTKIHEILEDIDFLHYDLSSYSLDSFIQNKIVHFLDSDFMRKRLSFPMYKEYEFYYENENTLSHGIMDLLIDEGDSYTILDYKLKGIEDSSYDRQLNGYRRALIEKTHKPVRCYLYSLLDEKYREVLDD